MANLNKVFLIGNLTREPEMRQAGASQICSFGMAINRTFQTNRGETREETCFVDVEAWGRQGEVIMQYTHKGSPLFVEGRLRYDQWDDRETGKKRSRLSVTAEAIQLLGGPRDNTMAPQGGFAEDMPGGQQPYYQQQPPQQGGYYQPQQAAYGRAPMGGGYYQQAPQYQQAPAQGYNPSQPMPAPAPQQQAPAPQQNQPPAMPAFQPPAEEDPESPF